jgi:hypothetical protein
LRALGANERGELMKRLLSATVALGSLAVLLATVAAAQGLKPPGHTARLNGEPTSRDFDESRGRNFGNFASECPHAKYSGIERPLTRIDRDQVWRLSERGDDLRFNYDLSCFPQNETMASINPRNPRNIIGGANDYQGEYNQFDASTSRGRHVYGSTNPNPSNPFGYNLTQSDPVLIYDRDGVAYNQEIAFTLHDDANGVFVWRSTNGGFTWSRPCIPFAGDPDPDNAVCGGVGDPRQPADGVITFNEDPTPGTFDGDAPFDDKNWMAAGPRPDGVAPVCFTPVTRTPTTCDPDVIGSDRLHATWTRFDLDGTSRIMHSYSDDQARSWSPAKPISGSAAFCIGGTAAASDCDQNQFSVPTVHPRTGLLGVAFENFNTPDENQYVFVRSNDGAQTFAGPFHITPVFDVNYPTGATRPDCRARGQAAGREVLTNSCFRVNSGGAVVVDKRGTSMTSGFGDDFYLVMSDNRSGTAASSNTDVFFFRSTNGGMTWIGPTRVNDDRSVPPPVGRGCGAGPACRGDFGNDQWFPWIDVNANGILAVAFYDRREDEDSMAHAWPLSRERPGNYLTWRWGAGCDVDDTPSRECLAPGAVELPQPTVPVNPGADPVPGQGPSFLGPFANSVLSDVPSNMDYSFRAGLFMGDYDTVAYANFPQLGGSDERDALAVWTDARNGRGSGAPSSFQAGRNPPCEHADMFIDYFNPLREDHSDSISESEEEAFLITPCPGDEEDDNDNDDD